MVGTTSFLSRSDPHSLNGVHALSLRGLSLPSNGSLPAVFPVGARATLVCDSGLSVTSAAADFGALFLAG